MQQTEVITFIIIASILLIVFVVGIIAFVLQYRKKRLEHENEKIMINVKHNEELLATQLEMQLQTMQHIGREIHDNVGQKLTLASLYTQQLSYESKAPQINDKIENISIIINESLQELRRLSKSLTDDAIADKDFVALLRHECEAVQSLKQCAVNFASSHQSIQLPYQQKSILLRVVQEFLQNAIKHAKCTQLSVTVLQQGGEINLRLEDNGIGFDTDTINNRGIGLKNMAKRIQMLKGQYKLKSTPGSGTGLTIKIPYTV